MAARRSEGPDNFGSDDAENCGKASSFFIVAAIDFGTTYSGYAFSLKDDYYKDHTKVYTNKLWPAGENLLSYKTPTTVLFEKDGKYHAFGFQAETKYANLAEANEHDGWQYFRRFKMELHENEEIRMDMMLKDDQGKAKLALEVFSASITFLKDHLIARLKEMIDIIRPEDIKWVLTVPAIWNDGAKQFMEEAAKKAGISPTQLVLALEPECAAIYCKELNVQKAKETKQQANLKAFDTGEQFMLVDLGGGTVDITVHEVCGDGSLKEIIPPSGGPWGGTVVDKAFFTFLRTLFTNDVIGEFETGRSSKSDYLELERRFEVKKRALTNCNGDFVVINVPLQLLLIFNDVQGTSFETSLKLSKFSQTVQQIRDKLKCNPTHFVNMYTESKEQVIAHIKELLARPELRRVSTLILVGGFSESEIISEALKNELKTKRVVLPVEAGLAVVKGAVMYGFNENSISSRIMRFTYGIATAVPYDDRFHPLSKKEVRYGNAKCEDIFKVFVEKGKEVVPHKTIVENTFNCPYLGDPVITIEIYTSDQKEPRFIDDPGSRKVGELNLQLQRSDPDQVQMINVKMLFGKTQLEVQAREHGRYDGSTVKAKFDFLGN